MKGTWLDLLQSVAIMAVALVQTYHLKKNH